MSLRQWGRNILHKLRNSWRGKKQVEPEPVKFVGTAARSSPKRFHARYSYTPGWSGLNGKHVSHGVRQTVLR